MKNRYAVTCNGRPAFYAAMYEDIRQCAMDRGWAVALHGSLSTDMDIMAMPWEPWASSFEILVMAISTLFDGNSLAENYAITYNEKPFGRIVATIPIFGDFYLDISTIQKSDREEKFGEWEVFDDNQPYSKDKISRCSVCKKGRFIAPGYDFCPFCGTPMNRRKVKKDGDGDG